MRENGENNGGRAAPARMPAKQNKKYQKRVYTSFMSVLVVSVVFLTVTAYIGESVYKFLNRTPVPTITLQNEIADASDTYSGVIIRDEKVYASTASGDVHYNFSDLDRVRKGDVVCDIQDDAAVSNITQDINKLDDNILQLQRQRSDLSIFSGDVKLKNDQIKAYISDNIYNFSAGNFSAVYAIKDNLDLNIGMRNEMLLQENRGSLTDMTGQKAALSQKLNSQVTPIAAAESGIVSYNLDGYENTYRTDNMVALSASQTSVAPAPADGARKTVVKANDAVFKIIASNTWYIGAYIPGDKVSGWKKGDYETLYLENGGTFQPRIGQIIQITDNPGNGPGSYVLIQFTKYMLDFAGVRSVNIKISDDAAGSYRVPDSAVIQRTILTIPNDFVSSSDSKQVFVRTDGGVNAVDVDISSADDVNTYVFQDLTRIKTGDVLTDADTRRRSFTISEFKTVSGVFVVNDGFARFIEVSPLADDGSGFTTLPTDKNRRLHDYDKIVSDAQRITDGEKIIN